MQGRKNENRGAGDKNFYRFFHSNASKFETSIPPDRMLKQWKLLRFTSQFDEKVYQNLRLDYVANFTCMKCSIAG